MDLVAHIKSYAPILDVATNYGVKLKKLAKTHTGLCPVHQEKSPSFHVDPERGHFKCYGCGAKGDQIQLVQSIESCDFKEACRALIQMFNIPEPERYRRQAIREEIRKLESAGRLDEAKILMLELN